MAARTCTRGGGGRSSPGAEVYAAAVLGVPDEMTGERVGAVIVPVLGTALDMGAGHRALYDGGLRLPRRLHGSAVLPPAAAGEDAGEPGLGSMWQPGRRVGCRLSATAGRCGVAASWSPARISLPTEFRGRRSTKVTKAGTWCAVRRSRLQARSSWLGRLGPGRHDNEGLPPPGRGRIAGLAPRPRRRPPGD